MPTLCLGTAQFGLDYGVTNNNGAVSGTEISAILDLGLSSGINRLDTAPAYGNAESLLGINGTSSGRFEITSKAPKHTRDLFDSTDVKRYDESLRSSLSNLGISQLSTYLLHNSYDLKKPGSDHLTEWLLSLKRSGIVERLGISIYEASELDDIESEFTEVVQLPLSLYDQRLIQDKTIESLSRNGSKVCARSVFLQGLLACSSERWPSWISNEALCHHKRLEKTLAGYGLTPLEAALAFLKEQIEIDSVIVGVCSSEQLQMVLDGWRHTINGLISWDQWAISNGQILDPRSWPKS